MTERVQVSIDAERLSLTLDAPRSLAGLLTTIFADVASPEEPLSEPLRYRVEVNDSGSFEVSLNGVAEFAEGLEGEFLTALVSSMNRAVAACGDGRLSLHAALLAREGQGVVIAGDGFAGKSTLALALTDAGWTYGGDEVVGVDADGAAVIGFPKPITMKRGTASLFDGLPERAPVDDRGTRRDGEPLKQYLPASSVGSILRGPIPPRLIVLLGGPDQGNSVAGTPAVSLLDPGDATISIANSAFAQPMAEADQLFAAASLASRCTVARVDRQPLDSMIEIIGELWEATPPSHRVARLRSVSGSRAVGISIDRTAVVSAGRRLFSIDPIPPGLWDALVRNEGAEGICRAVAESNEIPLDQVRDALDPVFAELAIAGLLERGS